MLAFLIALLAGFLTPHAEAPLARPLAALMGDKLTLEPGETRVLSFILVMLLAGIAAELLDSGSTFWVILGGGLGYFALRLVAAAQTVLDQRRK